MFQFNPTFCNRSKIIQKLLQNSDLVLKQFLHKEEEELCPFLLRISHSSVHSIICWSQASEESRKRETRVSLAGLPKVRSQSIHIYSEMSLSGTHPGSLLLNVCIQGEVIPAADCYMAEATEEKGRNMIWTWIIYHSSASVAQGSVQKVAYFQAVQLNPACAHSPSRQASERSCDLSHKDGCKWHKGWKAGLGSPLIHSPLNRDHACMTDGRKPGDTINICSSELCPHGPRCMFFITFSPATMCLCTREGNVRVSPV